MNRKPYNRPVASSEPATFHSREEHEAAIVWSWEVGTSLESLPAADIIEPLPLTLDELARQVAVARVNERAEFRKWAKILCEWIDGRAPWRKPSFGYCQHIPGGTVIIRASGIAFGGWYASLFRYHEDRTVTEHALAYARSGKRVVFDTADQAMNDMQATVNAGGNPPPGRAWLPYPDLTPERYPWSALPSYKTPGFVLSGPTIAGITRVRPDGRRWVIEEYLPSPGVYVRHRGRVIGDGDKVRDFGTVEAAKAYCSQEDAKW
jgi:hypothetical protein